LKAEKLGIPIISEKDMTITVKMAMKMVEMGIIINMKHP